MQPLMQLSMQCRGQRAAQLTHLQHGCRWIRPVRTPLLVRLFAVLLTCLLPVVDCQLAC